MSEQSRPGDINPTSPAETAHPRKTGMSGAFSRVGMTQIALAVLAGIFLWQWLAGQRAIGEMERQLANKIAEMDGNSKANQILLAQSQEQVRELSAKLASLETRYAETHSQRAALESLYTELAESRDELALAETEQMLLIASQQLQLSGNAKVALIAMQNADALLQRMNRAAFNGLRKAIAQDMAKLQALPSVDISGVSNQLDNLMASVDSLPLAYRQRAAPQTAQPVAPKDETFWQKLLREIGQEIRGLVRIENTGMDEIPLLPPNQEFFLRENLKLRLMSARLALMSRDEEGFRRELKTAQLWTARYFDAKSAEGSRMTAGLNKLAASGIRIELPDITSSLQAVRTFRLAREREPRAAAESRSRIRQ